MKKGLNFDKYYWETQCCFCLLSWSSPIHWGLALTSTTNQILCLAFHISCLAFSKLTFDFLLSVVFLALRELCGGWVRCFCKCI